MRTVRAATEIASARSVLASVGIEAEVPTALPALDDHRAELFGYVIREGVTNIVRHSGAHTATVTVTEDRVRISDDGERSEEHTSELQSRGHLVCRLLLDKKQKNK